MTGAHAVITLIETNELEMLGIAQLGDAVHHRIVVWSVNSTGAIAGNLLGLLYPDQVMNHRWRAQIECPDIIDRLA